MNDQEAYEKVRAWLTRPGATRAVYEVPSPNSLPICAYRTPDGNKCAIGCLIPDELYEKDMEGKIAVALIRDNPQLVEFFKNCTVGFLDKMQGVHDSASNWDENGFTAHGLAELDYIADTHGLKVVK